MKHFYYSIGFLLAFCLPAYGQDVAKEYNLQEVQVTAKRHDFGAKSSQMSAIAISAERIKKLPMLLGEVDVAKSLQTLPGVQSGGEGRAGIFVRGGDYDQNLFMLDGITFYNPEHLQGFTSAINADLLDDVVLYKGAFPSRFGSRLSSVIDISLREGDMEKHHASITAGMLASRIQAEGPLWKGHTSFNIGARISYFNAIVNPLLKEVVYDNPGQMNNFSHMKYYDINAKLTHRFSDKAKLNAMFYYGRDDNNATPNETTRSADYNNNIEFGYLAKGIIDNTSLTQRTNKWNNLLGGLFYEHQLLPSLRLNASVSYSGYDYRLKYTTQTSEKKVIDNLGLDKPALYSLKTQDYNTNYISKVQDVSMQASISYVLKDKHELQAGVQLGLYKISPEINFSNYLYTKKLASDLLAELISLGYGITIGEEDYGIAEQNKQNSIAGKGSVTSLSAYIEDDMNLTDWLKINMGLRLQGYDADGQTHLQLEPRASMRLMMSKGLALKMSYARMSQGLFMLTSASLITPSEVWMPLNKEMKPGISDQVSAGLAKDFDNGIQLSLEGYYKWLDNVVDYREGVSIASANKWNALVAQGRGRAYGIEFMAQKTEGNTRGHISYTWSKSLRTFDRPDMELNSGKEFYAPGDRRHNFNISITQRLSKNWDFSASWTFQSGRRANISTTTITGGSLDEYNDFHPGVTETNYNYALNPNFNYLAPREYENTYFEDILRIDTYRNRNSYTLPPVHRLDISLSHHGNIGIGELICDIGIYNLYNRQNLSSVYWGYTDNKPALKGVCLFPIMPSISLTLKL